MKTKGGHEEAQETGEVSTSEEKQNGISAANESVTRDEDVTGEQDGINAVDKSEVTVDGNVTGEHHNGIDTIKSDVTVVGNVSGGHEGIHATVGSDITVSGDVTSEGEGVIAIGESKVEVGGNVTAGDGEAAVEVWDASNITIGGERCNRW